MSKAESKLDGQTHFISAEHKKQITSNCAKYRKQIRVSKSESSCPGLQSRIKSVEVGLFHQNLVHTDHSLTNRHVSKSTGDWFYQSLCIFQNLN